MSQFWEVKLNRIPQEQNTATNQLAKSASSAILNNDIIIVRQSSLKTTEVNLVHTETSWMTPIISYLQGGILPDDRHEAKQLKVHASWFIMLQGTLYKRGFSLPYPQMPSTRWGRICFKRNTRRRLWEPLKGTILIKEDRQSRLLLAIHTGGC